MKRVLLYLMLVVILFALPVQIVQAETPKNKGLFISPLRQYISLDAGTQKVGEFTIANLTDTSIDVNLSIKQFSVSDYAYNYRFSSPNNWLKLSTTTVSLKPNESHDITYSLNVPTGTAAGGQYYTLFASADLGVGTLKSTVQATTLLYVTVNGKLIRTSQLVQSSIQHISFSKQIHYTIDAKNTGNVHYFANFAGQLHGLFIRNNASGSSHLLLPGAIRQVTADISAPILPGIYKATYGYRTDAGDTVNESSYVVFIPPWSIALLALLVLVSFNIYGRRQRQLPTKEEKPEKNRQT